MPALNVPKPSLHFDNDLGYDFVMLSNLPDMDGQLNDVALNACFNIVSDRWYVWLKNMDVFRFYEQEAWRVHFGEYADTLKGAVIKLDSQLRDVHQHIRFFPLPGAIQYPLRVSPLRRRGPNS